MKPSRTLFFAASLAVFALTVSAQPKPGAPGASDAGMGMGGGMHGHAGADNTYGWSMMTPQEQDAYQKKMMGMKSHDECKAYTDKHHQQMADRAKQRGTPMPVEPKHGMCEGLSR